MSTNQLPRSWANRYCFLKLFGSGAYGKVYKVKDTKCEGELDSVKALKEIPIINMVQEAIDDCAREAKFLAKIQHVNIVKLFDSFAFEDSYCIVTEFCDGGDLDQLIGVTKKAGKSFEEKRILRWFIQIIQALNYIHLRKILHRDLKCRNIFLKNDSVKLGDFGISRILNCTTDLASTFIGTPFYMSPEVLKHDGYNTGSDIWSAGVILYEMCALKHAFDAPKIMSLMMLIVDGPCPEIPDYYSTELQNIISRILVKDHNQRPNTQEILNFPYIQKSIKDPCIDLPMTIDPSATILRKDFEDIQRMLSTPISIADSEFDNEETISPSQQLQIRKRLKADKQAETLKEITKDVYIENRTKSAVQRAHFEADSLPFTNRRFHNATVFIPDVEKTYNDKKKAISQTCQSTFNMYSSQSPTPTSPLSVDSQKPAMARPKSQMNNRRVSNSDRQRIPLSKAKDLNKTTEPPLNNGKELYDSYLDDHSALENIKFLNETYTIRKNPVIPHDCSVTKFNIDDVPEDLINELSQYDNEEFENSDSDINGSNEEDKESKPISFKDDEENDPFGNKSKARKIVCMKDKCLEYIDETTYQKALEYLSKKNCNEKSLLKICNNDKAAFLISQIHFLNNKANAYETDLYHN